jgi:hypothetical protein
LRDGNAGAPSGDVGVVSLSLSWGLGATTEETNKRDGGGCGEKRRRHDNELEAVAAELAWRPAVAAAVAAVVAAAAFGEKTPILCVTEKNKKKQSPYWYGDPRTGLGRDFLIFQFGESP